MSIPKKEFGRIMDVQRNYFCLGGVVCWLLEFT
jgi:hypothetical protein